MSNAAISEAVTDELSKTEQRVASGIYYFNECVLVMFLGTVQWVGWWNLLAYWTWPGSTGEDERNITRDVVYFIFGCFLKFLANKFFPLEDIRLAQELAWAKGIPKNFSWRRKLKNYITNFIHFIAFVICWIGAWNVIDLYIFEYSLAREVSYIIVPFFLSLILEEYLSKESLLYMFARFKRGRVQDYDEETPLSQNNLKFSRV